MTRVINPDDFFASVDARLEGEDRELDAVSETASKYDYVEAEDKYLPRQGHVPSGVLRAVTARS